MSFVWSLPDKSKPDWCDRFYTTRKRYDGEGSCVLQLTNSNWAMIVCEITASAVRVRMKSSREGGTPVDRTIWHPVRRELSCFINQSVHDSGQWQVVSTLASSPHRRAYIKYMYATPLEPPARRGSQRMSKRIKIKNVAGRRARNAQKKKYKASHPSTRVGRGPRPVICVSVG